MDKETAGQDISYYWRNYGDLERGSDWEECLSAWPYIEKAWHDYKYAKTVLDALIDRTVRAL